MSEINNNYCGVVRTYWNNAKTKLKERIFYKCRKKRRDL